MGYLRVMIDVLFFLRDPYPHQCPKPRKSEGARTRGWMAALAWNDATGRGGNDACNVRIGHRARRQRVWVVASPRSRS